MVEATARAECWERVLGAARGCIGGGPSPRGARAGVVVEGWGVARGCIGGVVSSRGVQVGVVVGQRMETSAPMGRKPEVRAVRWERVLVAEHA